MISLRKVLTISLIICIILVVLCQFVLPGIATSTVNTKLQSALQTDKVQTEMSTFPGCLLMFGQMDKIHVEAENGRIGNVRCSKLVLDGKNVRANISAFDVKDGSAVESADELTLTGTITEANLQEYMADRLDGVENLTVKMTNKETTASGQIKLLGRAADVSITGNFYEERGLLYFHMTGIDIRNALLGHAVIGNLFGDMLLVDLQEMAFPAEFNRVEQHDGYVVLVASYKALEGMR